MLNGLNIFLDQSRYSNMRRQPSLFSNHSGNRPFAQPFAFQKQKQNTAAQHSFEVAVKKVMIMDYSHTFVILITPLILDFSNFFQLFFFLKWVCSTQFD